MYSYLFIGRSEQMSEENTYTESKPTIGSFEEKLQQVANEIDHLRDSFTKSSEDLSRIKNMLDIDAFKGLSSTIENFEGQLSEVERQKQEAYQGAQKYSQELEKEKERLIKLWDAYKKQEEELSQAEAKIQEYEKQATTYDTEKQQLEAKYQEQLNTLQEKVNTVTQDTQKIEQFQNQINEYTNKYQTLEQNYQQLQTDATQKQSTIDTLQQEVTKYKEFEQYKEFKAKYDELNTAYEKEKDRLTKLYHLYEETEQECNRLKGDNLKWQNWYNSNKDIFNKLFSGAPPTPMPKGPEKPFNKRDITPTPEPGPQHPSPSGFETKQTTPTTTTYKTPEETTKTTTTEEEKKKQKKGFFRR